MAEQDSGEPADMDEMLLPDLIGFRIAGWQGCLPEDESPGLMACLQGCVQRVAETWYLHCPCPVVVECRAEMIHSRYRLRSGG